MDYKTFTEAFSHNRRTHEHLINLLSNQIDNTAQFSLFLGAGASVSSGVKTAAQMVAGWRRKQFAACKTTDDFSSWLNKQEWYGTDDEYSTLFELTYDQPAQRRAHIEKAISKARPSWGYAYLVSLINENLFNVVFTTNFDDLLNDACYNFTTSIRPMVCAHDSAVSSVRVVSDRPKIIKLHGDYLYDSIKNTSNELQSLAGNMRDKFSEFAKQYGLIVLGYSGSDQSVMDLLDVLVRSESYFRNGLYWCIAKGTCPGRRLQQLLRNDRVFWVEIDGFDEFVGDLADSVRASLPEGVSAPHATAFDRAKHLLDDKPKSNHPLLIRAYSDTHEVYTKIKQALDQVGLTGWKLDKEDNGLDEFSRDFIPFLKTRDLVKKKRFVEACKTLRQLASNLDSEIAQDAWELLMECLLRSKSTHGEAKSELAKPPPPAWQDSSHYLVRSYFSLLLNDGAAALKYADRALELNRELAAAKINRAFACLMLKDDALFLKYMKELQTNNIGDQYKAAVCVMSADLSSAIHDLQQAIVLGRYSAKDSFKDVVFRVLWGLPEFENAIKPFCGDDAIEYPYQEACPITDPERELQKKITKVKQVELSKKTSKPKLRTPRRR